MLPKRLGKKDAWGSLHPVGCSEKEVTFDRSLKGCLKGKAKGKVRGREGGGKRTSGRNKGRRLAARTAANPTSWLISVQMRSRRRKEVGRTEMGGLVWGGLRIFCRSFLVQRKKQTLYQKFRVAWLCISP